MEMDPTSIDDERAPLMLLPPGLISLAARAYAQSRARLANSAANSEFAEVLIRTTSRAPQLQHILSCPHHRAVCSILPAPAGIEYLVAEAFDSPVDQSRPAAGRQNILIWRDNSMRGTEEWRFMTHPVPRIPTFAD
jgi:hypothetical protein